MLTIVTKKKLVFYPIDGERFKVLSLVDKLQRSVRRIQQTLSIQRLEVDDLEAVCASDTQLRLQEVYRA